jgi:hypothetical protein
MKSTIRGSNSCTVALFFILFLCTHVSVRGQINRIMLTGASLNGIPTSVPFLTIAPDGRSAGMGDGGVASIPDVYSQHWNNAKYAFVEAKAGISFSYIPWATNLIPDVNHFYLSGYYKIDAKNTLSTSFRYFSLNTITAGGGTAGTQYHPKEFAVDAGYSRKFSNSFSGGVVLRYIHSDLTDGRTTSSGQDTQVGKSVAGDLGLYYQKNVQLGEKDAQWALGLNISNIGSPISYSKDAEATPIPTNLRLGGRFTYNFNQQHSLSIHADLNKLLVPTPAVYESDSATGELSIIRGKASPKSVIRGMLQSFYDAPGVLRENGSYSVIAEEFYEISFALGVEYWYRKLLAFRTGYFHEHAAKGNRKYFTFGLGARYRFINFDLAYLLPVEGQNSALFNTFQLSLALAL